MIFSFTLTSNQERAIAAFGKFHRIGKQIKENLTQTQSVHQDGRWDLSLNSIAEIKPFFLGTKFYNILYIMEKGKRMYLCFHNLKLSIFYLRNIQDIINQEQEMFTGPMDGSNAVSLLICDRIISQQDLGITENGIQGGSQLMGYTGKKG